MIEKLKTLEDDEIDMSVGAVNTRFADTELVRKINELVDAVNYHQKWLSEIQCHIDTQPAENSTNSKMENVDPYAEQRKWIGKLCRFWDDDNTNSSCGILTSIDTEIFKEPQFVCNDEYDYEHCKPVSPDDDIIYKKEQQ